MKQFFIWGLMAVAMMFVSCDEDDFKYDGDWFGAPEISNVTANSLKIKCTTSINESVLNGNQAGFKYVAIEGAEQGVFRFAKGEVSEGVMSADIKGLTSQTRYALYPIIDFGSKIAEGQKVMATTLEGSDPTPGPDPDPDPEPTPEEKPTIATPTAPEAEITETSATLYCVVSYKGDETLSYAFLYRKTGENVFQEVKAAEAKSFSLNAEVLAAGTVKVSATVTGLTEATAYEYKLQVKAGEKSYESILSKFTTKKHEGGGEVDPTPDPNMKYKGWAELPSEDLSKKDKEYFYAYHLCPDFKVGSQKMRNFTACYSKSKICPVWVAAPLHMCYAGSGRHDKYRNDPLIKCDQNGRWDGYTRGHMLGSAERNKYIETNHDVFYYSNIGPQLGSSGYFNCGGGQWNTAEDWVDKQWRNSSDTCYQIVGCYWDPQISPKKVKGTEIPTHYYTVLLKAKKGVKKWVGACSENELQAIVIWVRHKNYSKGEVIRPDGFESHGMFKTVAEVEKLTGHKFFPNVPHAPKNSYNTRDWNW